MAAAFGLAVRFKPAGDSTYDTVPVANAEEQQKVIEAKQADGAEAFAAVLSYVPLPAQRLTQDQRERYFYELVPDDAVEFMAWVLDHQTEVYDDAVLNTARVNRLRTLRSKTPTTKDTR